jgi:chitinase
MPTKSLAVHLSILALGLTTTAFSATGTNNFSPYADITLNTYWDSHYQDLEPANLLEISQTSGVAHFHLAFITDAGHCTPAWASQAAYSVDTKWAAHLTDQLRSHGIGYTVSFGGASGADLSAACDSQQLVTALLNVIQTYQPTGLDFDIENGTANVPKLMTALKQVQNLHPKMMISLTLPTLSSGLTAREQAILAEAKSQQLEYVVNIMAMDYGPDQIGNMVDYAIQAASRLFALLKTMYPEKSDAMIWKMIEVTPMIGVNDIAAEQFTLADADTLRTFADKNQLAGLSMWAINRDHACSDQWANIKCSGNNLQTRDYEFSERLMGK